MEKHDTYFFGGLGIGFGCGSTHPLMMLMGALIALFALYCEFRRPQPSDRE